MMYNNSLNEKKGGFPNPLADEKTKGTKKYGLSFAKAIEKPCKNDKGDAKENAYLYVSHLPNEKMVLYQISLKTH